MAEQDQDRNESATPFKLDEARKRGSVSKSMDVNTLMILLAGSAVLYFSGARIVQGELRLFSYILSNSHHVSFEMSDLSITMTKALVESLLLLLPLFLTVGIIAGLSNFLQTGPVFSFFPLKPDFDRINPVKGFKRVFSIRLVVESIKTILKLAILGTVLFYAIRTVLPTLIYSLNISPRSIGSVLHLLINQLLMKLLIALAFITMIDVLYTRWDFSKRMRMSRREIRDEHKRREGDPRIKTRLRELQRETLKRSQSLGKVKDADVLITNPVHLAVAIKYDREKIDAPLVIAKGAGFLAAKMREVARHHRVPVVENKLLARALFFHTGIDQAVPVEHYGVMAKIIFWAYSVKGMLPPESNT